MNTQLVTAPGRQKHQPQPVQTVSSHPVRRVGLLDRAALHLGLALVKWGRRPITIDLHERARRNAELLKVRQEVELARATQAGYQSRVR
jgi:hypothetical protein